jgi:hypothetical protein
MLIRGGRIASSPESWKNGKAASTGNSRFGSGSAAQHSAVSSRSSQAGKSKVAIKLIAADAEADQQLSRCVPQPNSHPHLMRIYDAGRCRLDGTSLLYW